MQPLIFFWTLTAMVHVPRIKPICQGRESLRAGEFRAHTWDEPAVGKRVPLRLIGSLSLGCFMQPGGVADIRVLAPYS